MANFEWTYGPEETPCYSREDGMHCDHWYDGEMCCACHDDPENVEALFA